MPPFFFWLRPWRRRLLCLLEQLDLASRSSVRRWRRSVTKLRSLPTNVHRFTALSASWWSPIQTEVDVTKLEWCALGLHLGYALRSPTIVYTTVFHDTTTLLTFSSSASIFFLLQWLGTRIRLPQTAYSFPKQNSTWLTWLNTPT